MTKSPAYLSDVSISYGVDEIPSNMKDMDPWTVTLTTEYGSESFPFFLGKGHHGAEPEGPDVIYSLVSDASFLESEPEEVSYPVGKAIEANSRKMAHLFGSYWETLQAMDEDEIRAVF